MTLDLINSDGAIEAVQSALANSIGAQFGVMFSEQEADALLTALDRQGWAVEQADSGLTPPASSDLTQDSYELPVQVHLHVSPSDTAPKIDRVMAAIRSGSTRHWG